MREYGTYFHLRKKGTATWYTSSGSSSEETQPGYLQLLFILKDTSKYFPGSSAGKESACSAGDLGSTPGLGRSPGEGNGYPLRYSGLENSMDGILHGVAESDTTERLSLDLIVILELLSFRT